MKIKNKKQAVLSEKFRKDESIVVKKFLWFPVMAEGEIRWLETASIERIPWVKTSFLGTSYYWLNVKFVKS